MTCLVLLTSGCATWSRYTTPATNDSTQHTIHRTDSLYRRDSIVVREYVRGDTVFVDRWRDRVRQHVSVRTDTLYLTHEVTVTLPPERYVPKPVKGLAWIGATTLVLLLLLVIRKVCQAV